jgi:hypothetical protein
VQACIHDSGDVVGNFVAAVKKFESNDPKKIQEGLRLLA